MSNQLRVLHLLALGAAVFFWSAAFIVSKDALSGMYPLTLCIFRMLLCFLILLPLAWKRGFRFPQLFTKQAFVFGAFGSGGNLVLLTVGLTSCSAGMSAVIHGLFPVFMILFGYFSLAEPITTRKIVAVLFAVSGVVFASVSDLTSTGGSRFFGICLVVGSVLTWAFYSVYCKKSAPNLDPLVLTELGFGTAFLCFFPLGLIEIAFRGFLSPDPSTFLRILYLSLVSGVIATIFWNTGVKKVPAVISGIFFNLMPVIGLAFAVLSGESTSPLQLIGCLLVLIGVLSASLPAKK